MVIPHLEYATPVWNPGARKKIEINENNQRRSTKKNPELKGQNNSERI